MAVSNTEIKRIFGEALALPPEQRPAYLQEACAGAPELRAEVDALLKAHGEAGSFLEEREPAGAAAAADQESLERGRFPTGERVGTLVAGRYKLLEQIGEG